MRRLLSKILILTMMMQLFVTTAYAKPDWPSDTGILAEGGIVIDMDSGAVLFGQNIKVGYYPASITKLLTALVVLEHAQLDSEVVFTDDAVNNMEPGSANPMELVEGDKMPVEDCLYLLILRSSNQCANALAEHVAGSRDGFVELMNEKIAQLGCTGSHFKNPSGLNDPEQVVTPYDMALIARAAFSNEKLLEIASTLNRDFPPTTNRPNGTSASMEHKLLVTEDSNSLHYYPDAVAGKTGYTSLAGNTLVTLAERDGRRVIAVVLKGTQPQYYVDSKNLLDFGLDRFYNEKIAPHETAYTSGEEQIAIGDKSYLPSELTIDEDAAVTLPKDASYEDAEKTLETVLPSDHPAGAVALLKYTYNERVIGQAYIRLKNVPLEEPIEPAAADPANGQNESQAQPPADPDEPKSEPAASFPSVPVAVLIALAVALLLGCAAGYVVYSRKKEAKERELRRQKRLKRLQEIGCSEEEFEKLVAERKNKIN